MKEMLFKILKDIAGFGVRYAPSACIVAAGAVLLIGLVMLWLKKNFVLSRAIEGKRLINRRLV